MPSTAIIAQQGAMPVEDHLQAKTWHNAVAYTILTAGGLGTLIWVGCLAWIAEEAVRGLFS